MNIDFSSLSRPVTDQDIKAFEAYAATHNIKISTSPFFKTALIIMIGLSAILLIQFFVMSVLSGTTVPAPSVFIMVAITTFVLAMDIIMTRLRKKELTRLHRFAVSNHARLIVNLKNPDYVGAIFYEGEDRTVKEALVFSDGKEIGNYTYTIGSGKNKTTRSWGFMRVKLTRHLPHMLLDAKSNNLFGKKLSNLPATFSKKQTMRLEGNFNDYFTLYAPKGYERDALYVFTPDVMAKLIDYGAQYDMEVVDDNLIFYTNEPYRFDTADDLQKALDIIDKISTEILDQSDYYADERVGDRAANVIAQPGRRLESSYSVVVVILIAIAAVYFTATVVWPAFMFSTRFN